MKHRYVIYLRLLNTIAMVGWCAGTSITSYVATMVLLVAQVIIIVNSKFSGTNTEKIGLFFVTSVLLTIAGVSGSLLTFGMSTLGSALTVVFILGTVANFGLAVMSGQSSVPRLTNARHQLLFSVIAAVVISCSLIAALINVYHVFIRPSNKAMYSNGAVTEGDYHVSGLTTMAYDWENRLSVHENGAAVASYLYYTDNMKAVENIGGALTTLIWDDFDLGRQ